MDWRIDFGWKKNEGAPADHGNTKENKFYGKAKNNILKKNSRDRKSKYSHN